MNRNVGTIIALSVLLSLILMSCSSTKQLQTQATESVTLSAAGQLEDVIRSAGMQELWIFPTERKGVIDYDTIRHQIDLKDNVRRKSDKKDTVRHQALAEQTKGKVKTKQKGLADDLRADSHEQDATSVWLFISVGFNVLSILVIIIVISLGRNRLHTVS